MSDDTPEATPIAHKSGVDIVREREAARRALRDDKPELPKTAVERAASGDHRKTRVGGRGGQ